MMATRTITRCAAAVLAATTLLASAVPASADCTQDGCYDDPKGSGASALDAELAGVTFYEPYEEAVDVAAHIHLVTQPPRADGSVALQVNVAGATARGLETGQRYGFTGADSVLIPADSLRPDGPPIRVALSFRLQPDGPPIAPAIPGNPVRVAVTAELGVDAAGRLANAAINFDSHSGD